MIIIEVEVFVMGPGSLPMIPSHVYPKLMLPLFTDKTQKSPNQQLSPLQQDIRWQ